MADEEKMTDTQEPETSDQSESEGANDAVGNNGAGGGGGVSTGDMSGQQSLGDEISNSASDTANKIKDAAKSDVNRMKDKINNLRNGGNNGQNANNSKGGNKSGDSKGSNNSKDGNKGGGSNGSDNASKGAEGAAKGAEAASNAANGAVDAASGGAGGAISAVGDAIKGGDKKASEAIKNAKAKGDGGNNGGGGGGKSMGDEISNEVGNAMKAVAAIAVTVATAGAGAAAVGGGAAAQGGVEAAKAIAQKAGKAAAKAATNADVSGGEEMSFMELIFMLLLAFIAGVNLIITGVFALLVAIFKQVWDFIVSLFTEDDEDEVDWATYMPNDEYVKLSKAINEHIKDAWNEMDDLWEEDKDLDADEALTVYDGDTAMYFNNIFGKAIKDYNAGKADEDKYNVNSWMYIGNGHNSTRHSSYSNWYFSNKEDYSNSKGTNHYYPQGLQDCEGYEGYFDEARSETEFADHSDEGKIADMCYVISGYNTSKREKPITESDNWFAATFKSYKWDIEGMIWDQEVDSEGWLSATGQKVVDFFAWVGEKIGLGDGPAAKFFNYEVVRIYDSKYPRKYNIMIQDQLVDKPVSKAYTCEETKTYTTYKTYYTEPRYYITFDNGDDVTNDIITSGCFPNDNTLMWHCREVLTSASSVTVYMFAYGESDIVMGVPEGTYVAPLSMLDDFRNWFGSWNISTELCSEAVLDGPYTSTTTSKVTHDSGSTSNCAATIQAMIEDYYSQSRSIHLGDTVINEDGVSLQVPIEDTPEKYGYMSYADAAVPFSTAKGEEVDAIISAATDSPAKLSKSSESSGTTRDYYDDIYNEGWTNDYEDYNYYSGRGSEDYVETYTTTDYSYTDWTEDTSRTVTTTFESSHYITVNCNTLYWYLKASTSPFDSDLFLATLFEQSSEYISDEERDHIDYNDDLHAYTKDVDAVKRTTYVMPNFSRNETDTEITSENYGEIKLTTYNNTTAKNLNEMEADFVVNGNTYDHWLICWFEENGIKEQPYYGSVTLFQYECGCLGTSVTCSDSEVDVYNTADGTDPRTGDTIVEGWEDDAEHDGGEGCGAKKVESDGEGTNGYISEKQINGKDLACKTQTSYLLDENGDPVIDSETGEKVSIGTTYLRVIDKITSGSEELYHTCISTHQDAVESYYGTYDYSYYSGQALNGVSLDKVLNIACQVSEYFGDLKADNYRSIPKFDSTINTIHNTRFADYDGKNYVKLGKLQLSGSELKQYLIDVRTACMACDPTSSDYRTFIDTWDACAGATVGRTNPYYLGTYENIVGTEGSGDSTTTYDVRYKELPTSGLAHSLWNGTGTAGDSTAKSNALMDAITTLMTTNIGKKVMNETIAKRTKTNMDYFKNLGFTDAGALLVLTDIANQYGLDYFKDSDKKGKDIIANLTPSTATAQTVYGAYAKVDGENLTRREKMVKYITEMTEANNWSLEATEEHASINLDSDDDGTLDGEAYPDGDYNKDGEADWREYYGEEDYHSFMQDEDKKAG